MVPLALGSQVAGVDSDKLPADPMITAKQIAGIRIPCCERDINGDGNCDRHPASIEDVLRYYLRKEESQFSSDSRSGDIGAVRAINGALDQLATLATTHKHKLEDIRLVAAQGCVKYGSVFHTCNCACSQVVKICAGTSPQ